MVIHRLSTDNQVNIFPFQSEKCSIKSKCMKKVPSQKMKERNVRCVVFTAVTMMDAVFWDAVPCRSCVNRRFGRTYRLNLQCRKICERGTSVNKLQPPAHAGSSLAGFSTLKMEAICSSETSVHTRSTRRHIPEDGILEREKCLQFLQIGRAHV
jgi:hypothetical protein